jgi:hypothetical protein
VGGPIDANARSDPWFRSIEKLTPDQYVRRRIELAANDGQDAAVRLNISDGGGHAWRADVLRRWLLNGSLALSAAELSVVLHALENPINEPIDPLASEADLAEREAAVDMARFQLEVARSSRA